MSLYKQINCTTCKEDEDGQLTTLANFTAEIIKETRMIDGITNNTILTIKGEQIGGRPINGVTPKPIELPEVAINADEFGNFNWVLRRWGSRCVIFPQTGVKDDLRTQMQLQSTPTIELIYGTIGWMENERGHKMYLHNGGAITEKGNDTSIRVVLPPELQRYDLTTGEPGCDVHEAFHSSLDLIKLGPAEVMWPLWAATFAPILGPCDFAMHLAGRSGAFKSEIISLFQSHYGSAMDARNLPANWSSTGNALEALTYYAANALVTIDDFVPQGTSYQVKTLQSNADRVIRGQGNQAGRGRLTDSASLKVAYYPRGLTMSTGEDTPEGHSVRARMLIVELSPGDTEVKNLTESQKKRRQFPILMSEFIKDACDTVAPDFIKGKQMMTQELQHRVNEIRDVLLEIGHTRTPPMLARLVATVETVMQWAAERGFITKDLAETMTDQAKEAIIQAGMNQSTYLEAADPVQVFMNGLRTALAGQRGHVRSMQNGVPLEPEKYGWTQMTVSGEMPKYKAGGTTIGWVDSDENRLYFDADLAWAASKKETGNELAITKMTLIKRLKDAGILDRCDSHRNRCTVRISVEGHTRNVICFNVATFFDTQEVTNAGDNEQRDEDSGDTGDTDPFAIANH